MAISGRISYRHHRDDTRCLIFSSRSIISLSIVIYVRQTKLTTRHTRIGSCIYRRETDRQTDRQRGARNRLDRLLYGPYVRSVLDFNTKKLSTLVASIASHAVRPCKINAAISVSCSIYFILFYMCGRL